MRPIFVANKQYFQLLVLNFKAQKSDIFLQRVAHIALSTPD